MHMLQCAIVSCILAIVICNDAIRYCQVGFVSEPSPLQLGNSEQYHISAQTTDNTSAKVWYVYSGASVLQTLHGGSK